MIYVLINGIAIFLGAFVGRTIGKKMNEDQINSIMVGASLALIVMALDSALETENTLLMLMSLAIGGVIGAGIDIDGKFQKLGDSLRKVVKTSDENFTVGLVSVMMLHVVGSMAILGPISAALGGDPSVLLFKSVLDFSSSIIFSAIYGFGIALSGGIVIIYQGAIYILAGLLAPFITLDMTRELTAVGSVLLIAISFNMLDITKIKVSNFLPGILGPVFYYIILNLI